MALKKSDLYSSLWASCDELRGGMDASQYKDYVLFMLFIKYVSDKYGDSDDFAPTVAIPKGASFKDMIALKGKSDIGDKINTQIIQPLIDANARLARSDFPDFNDPNKLGEGQAMVDRLTNLVGIFQKPELDFSNNRADNDDILGDAYEYLMRHFAVESGKSKGQFLTPSEVSRILAKVIGITPENSKAATTVQDMTCGSGSLLLKVPAALLIARYFAAERDAIAALEAGLASIEQQLDEMREETNSDGELLLAEANEANDGDPPKVSAKSVKAALKKIGKDPEEAEARQALEAYAALLDQQADTKTRLKTAQDDLEAKLDAQYPTLTETDIQTLVVDDKWLTTLAAAVQGELDRVSQTLTGRIRQLAERYATPLPQLTTEVESLADKVAGHLAKMGFNS